MKKIILASASPRRKELLSALGLEFETWIKEIDENCPIDIPSEEKAIWVASRKADAWRAELKSNEILICADTIVVLRDEVLNKPQSREDAFDMLLSLSGTTHKVITGVVVESHDKALKCSIVTEVTFRSISVEEITHYLDVYKPYDKAGAYGIQEWIGHAFVTDLRGSYNNVVGLPTDQIYAMLKQLRAF